MQVHVAPSGRERLRDSYWVAWTFTLAFNWVAFFWIAHRARNRRWALWGCVYAVPFVVLMSLPETGMPTDAATWAAFVMGIASIVHAFKVRPAYIAQRRALLGLPLVAEHEGTAAQASPSRSTPRRVGHAVAVVALYAVVGLVVGGVVTIAALFADPCGPFCVSETGSERAEATEAAAIVGGLGYLALLVPIIWTWNTWRVWWVVSLGGVAIGALSLLGIWLAVQATSAPAFCNC